MAERAFISPSYGIPGFTKAQNAVLRRIIFEIEAHGPHEGSFVRGVSLTKDDGESWASDAVKRVTWTADSFGATSHDTGELRWSTADAGTIFCDREDNQAYLMSGFIFFSFGTADDAVFGHYQTIARRLNADATESDGQRVTLRMPRTDIRVPIHQLLFLKKGQGFRLYGHQNTGSSATVNAKIDIFGPWAGLVLPPGI